MSKYKTTVDFIRICKEFATSEETVPLAKNIGLPSKVLTHSKSKLKKIANFIVYLDTNNHKFSQRSQPFLTTTLHGHIASDFRSIMILILQEQNYQANIVTRHLIETFVMTLWGDLAAGFRDAFDYLIDTKEWKPYRSMQRMTWEFDSRFPNRSIKERLERVRLLNFMPQTGRGFYDEYFAKASSCDLILLLSLPICAACMKKLQGRINCQEFHLDTRIRKTGKEDEHAKYRTDFGFLCSFCRKQRLSQGYAMGIPEPSDMLDMLVAVCDERLANELRLLQKMYRYLSDEYVHFSMTHSPDTKPQRRSFGGRKTTLWGFEGTLFCLNVLKPLMEYYFAKLASIHENAS